MARITAVKSFIVQVPEATGQRHKKQLKNSKLEGSNPAEFGTRVSREDDISSSI
jgi:hypothetical protein